MPLSELENDSESVWVKVFVNKTSHYVASWYRPPGGSGEDFHLFGDQFDQIRNKYMAINSTQFMFQGISTSRTLLGQTDLTSQVQC